MKRSTAFPLLLSGLLMAQGASSLQSPATQSHTTSRLTNSLVGDSLSSSWQRQGRKRSLPISRSSACRSNLFFQGGAQRSHTSSSSSTRLKAVSFGERQQQDQQKQVQQATTRIPKDTSITNNPQIPTTDSQTTKRVLEKQNKPSWLRYLVPTKQMMPEIAAEAFGTFILLQLALGIVLSSVFAGSMQGVFPIAILTGMAITTACTIVSSKCAAHFNPAITWAMCLYRNFGWNKLLPYWMAQLVGAASAALVNYGMYASQIAHFEAKHGIVRSSLEGLRTAKSMGCYFSSPLISPWTAFGAETFGTFCLTAVVFALTSRRNLQAQGLFIPPIIGSAVALIISVVGPITAASLNPARELGPRLILKLFGWSSSVAFAQLGLYVGAAMLGATVGGLFVDQFLYPTTTRGEEVVPNLERESIFE